MVVSPSSSEKTAAPTEHLASFLDQNPDILIETDLNGNVHYLNPAAITQFPDLLESGPSHPLLEKWEEITFKFNHSSDVFVREIIVENIYYEQKFFYDPQTGFISISTQDVTERKQTEEHLAQQLKESQALLQTSQMLASSFDLSTTLQNIVEAAATLIIGAEQAVIHLLDDTEQYLQAVAVAKQEDQQISQRMNFKLGEGIAGRVIASGKTISIPDASNDRRYIPSKQLEGNVSSLLVAPISAEHSSIGTLSVHSASTGAFSNNDERLLTTLGTQAALAIRKTQLLNTEREQRQLAEALRDVAVTLGTTLDYETVLDLLLDDIGRVVTFDSASIMMIENGIIQVARMCGYDQYGEGVIESHAKTNIAVTELPHIHRMVASGDPIVIPDTEVDDTWVSLVPGVGSWAGAPIHAQGKVIGFFSLDKKESNHFQPTDADQLSAFAGQAALTLQNSRLFETTQRRLKEVNSLYQVSQGITESIDIDTMLRRILELLKEIFGYYHTQVYLLDEESGDLIVRQGSGSVGLKLKRINHRLSPGEGIVGNVAITGYPFVTNDVESVPFFVRNPFLPATQAEMAVPLRASNRLLGVLDIQLEPPKTFTDYDLRLMTTVADQLSSGIEKANLYAVLEEALTQEQTMRAQLVQSEKLAALGRIVASVAHELNNPLQAIQNALYLIQMEEDLIEQTKEDVQVALNETNRMAELIARLRETYRPTTSEEFQPGSINDIVYEVQKLLNTHLRHNNVVFDFKPDENLPLCPMIRDQIKQVTLNICLNAIETMPDGGSLSIETNQENYSREVILSVTDTGPGIAPEVLPYIFDPFVTTKEGGTGLGLAISYDIIRRHNGKIEAHSKPNEGTTFLVWLPLDKLSPENTK
jgi:signal transduction histidine kinase/PAS domain-containing protein